MFRGIRTIHTSIVSIPFLLGDPITLVHTGKKVLDNGTDL
jgi:hypothetical protein